MERILVTGNAGSGKTTLSRLLAEETKIPRYGLDSIVWRSGWQETSAEVRRERIQSLVSKPSWIIDGVSSQVFLAADTVYFMDIPLHRCLFNILKRFVLTGFHTRDDLPPGCPEYVGVFKAVRIALIYQRRTRPLIIKQIESHPEKRIVWIRSYSHLPASVQVR